MPISIHIPAEPVVVQHRRTVVRGLITGLAATILTATPLLFIPSHLVLDKRAAQAHGGGGVVGEAAAAAAAGVAEVAAAAVTAAVGTAAVGTVVVGTVVVGTVVVGTVVAVAAGGGGNGGGNGGGSGNGGGGGNAGGGAAMAVAAETREPVAAMRAAAPLRPRSAVERQAPPAVDLREAKAVRAPSTGDLRPAHRTGRQRQRSVQRCRARRNVTSSRVAGRADPGPARSGFGQAVPDPRIRSTLQAPPPATKKYRKMKQ
jgi:hypothetical protein